MAQGHIIPVVTATDGSFSADVRLYGCVVAVGLRIGTLSTPDVVITDGLTGAAVFSKAGIASDGRWQPQVLLQDDAGVDLSPDVFGAPAVTGILRVAITGGGSEKSGSLVILFTDRP